MNVFDMGPEKVGTMPQMLTGLYRVQLFPNIFNGTTCRQVCTGTVPRTELEL